jgi:hypothetical protein
MNYNKIKLINFHISLTKDGLYYDFFQDEDVNNGFDFYFYEDSNVKIFLQASVVDESNLLCLFRKLSVNPLENIKEVYNCLFETFQLYIWTKTDNQIFTLVDYLGVGANYVLETDADSFIFFSNFKNTKELGCKLKLSKSNLYKYLLLGYRVNPMELPYTNISTFEGGTIYKFDSKKYILNKIEFIPEELNIVTFKSIIKKNFQVSSLNQKLLFGATAGKDSLALLSLIKKEDTSYIAANFGNTLSDDVIQGEKISSFLNLPFEHCENVTNSEFLDYANEVSSISGGLSTCSYVDMLKFTAISIPSDYTYVMGEAGECYREFFESSNELCSSLDNYVTPSAFLEQCLHISENEIIALKEQLFSSIQSNYKGANVSEGLRNFYRHGRMPGNFSNRTKLINRYRNKSAPFLNVELLKTIPNINSELFKNDFVHKELVKSKKSLDWFRFFDKPIKSDVDSQDWANRFKNGIGKLIKTEIIEKNDRLNQELIDVKGLLILLNNELNKPSRGIYFILRIISFICFFEKNHNNIKLID